MLVGNSLSFLHQRFIAQQTVEDVNECCLCLASAVRYVDCRGLLWHQFQFLYGTVFSHIAVGADGFPVELHIVEWSEEVLVLHFEDDVPVLYSFVFSPDVLVEISHLVHLWVGYTVGRYQSVAVEVIV